MNKTLTIIAALSLTAAANADIMTFTVPQDFGPNDLTVEMPEYEFDFVEFVHVDAHSTLTLDVYWGWDVVNPNVYAWEFVNDTDVLMVWDTFAFTDVIGGNPWRLDLGMTLQHKAPAWGRNDSQIAIGTTPAPAVPAPGAIALLAAAGLVARRRRR